MKNYFLLFCLLGTLEMRTEPRASLFARQALYHRVLPTACWGIHKKDLPHPVISSSIAITFTISIFIFHQMYDHFLNSVLLVAVNCGVNTTTDSLASSSYSLEPPSGPKDILLYVFYKTCPLFPSVSSSRSCENIHDFLPGYRLCP